MELWCSQGVIFCCLGMWHARCGDRGCWIWFKCFHITVQRQEETAKKRPRFWGKTSQFAGITYCFCTLSSSLLVKFEKMLTLFASSVHELLVMAVIGDRMDLNGYYLFLIIEFIIEGLFTLLMPAYPSFPEKEAVKWALVCLSCSNNINKGYQFQKWKHFCMWKLWKLCCK